VFAEQQTAGRGRLGRQWISPFGRNIYLSVAWKFPAGASSLTGLSLAVGTAVVHALESYGLTGIGLKWPNDIVCMQRKLGGILVEVSGDAAGPCQVVMGIGLNLQMPQAAFNDLNQSWIDVKMISGKKIQRNYLAGLLLREILLAMPEFQRDGLAAFRKQWEQLDMLYGQTVNIQTPQGVQSGIAKGIDEQGNLQVDIDNKLHHFNSGEVSVRLSAPTTS